LKSVHFRSIRYRFKKAVTPVGNMSELWCTVLVVIGIKLTADHNVDHW